jgi:hypothetical protein
MAVVLFAMGGYGAAYLGWQIRVSGDGVSKEADHSSASIGLWFTGQVFEVRGQLAQPRLRSIKLPLVNGKLSAWEST